MLKNEVRFVLQLMVVVQVIRFLGILAIFAYPNALGVHDWLGLLQLHDGDNYFFIAQHGYYQSGLLQEKMANYAPLYPMLLQILGALVGLVAAPYVLNTLMTLIIPWLALKFAEKLVQSKNGTTHQAKIEMRRRIITIGIVLNPIIVAYSIFNLTEPLFYALLLGVLNCSVRQGRRYVFAELGLLFLLVMSRFVAVTICAYYFYLLVFQDNARHNYRLWIRPIACISVVLANFLVWDLILPRMFFGITAPEAMAKYWGVSIRFDLSSSSLAPKVISVGIGVLGCLYVLRMLVIRKNWSIFHFREKYLKQIQKQNAPDALLAPYDYSTIEALLFYGFCTLTFHALMDPLICFYRYVGGILPFYAFASIKNPLTKQIPKLIWFSIFVVILFNIFPMLILVPYMLDTTLSRDALPVLMQSAIVGSEIWLDMALIPLATIFFHLYYCGLPDTPEKMPNLRKSVILLSLTAGFLAFFNLYMP